MRFTVAIDQFVQDMQAQGKLRTVKSERSYRDTLRLHAEQVGNRDPRTTNRQDVKDTLRQWAHPNTQRVRRAYLISFYRWLVQEGIRKDNPAEQTRAPRSLRPQVYRLTLTETQRIMVAASTPRERRAIFLGVCAGLRAQELQGLQGRHFTRQGWVWVSADIAKGGHERWVPALRDVLPVIAEIQEHCELDDYVLPSQQFANPPHNTQTQDYPKRRADYKSIWRLVRRVGRQAGIAAPVTPHMLRHAFADHIARYAGARVAQQMLGHADLATTEGYLGQPTLDELAHAVEDLTFMAQDSPPADGPLTPLVETVGIEPTFSGNDFTEPNPRADGALFALFALTLIRQLEDHDGNHEDQETEEPEA